MADIGERLDRLERRIADLEAALAATGPARDPQVPTPAAPPVAVAAIVTPPEAAPMYWQLPTQPRGAAEAPPSGAPAGGGPAGPEVAEPPPPRPTWSLADLEERLSGRILAWAGGIALVVGGLFFLSLAFNRGWIGPEARVLVGLAAAAAALGTGAWLCERRFGPPALALVAVGVAVGMLALFAASALYGFIPAEGALIGSLVLAVGAAAIAIRADSQLVAGIGLLAAVSAPPIMGADPTLFAVLFLGAVLVGTTAIALWRSWSWLPVLAFLVAAPQVAEVFGDMTVAVEVAIVVGFWTLNAVAAVGGPFLRAESGLHRGSGVLLVLNALFAIFGLREALDAAPALRGSGLLLLAAVHGLIAARLLLRGDRRHPIGELAAGVGVAVVVIAIALELAGVARPIAWTFVAFGLAWWGIRTRHAPTLAGAVLTGALAVGHFVLVEYPVHRLELRRAVTEIPFASPEGIVTAVLVAAVAAVTWFAARQVLEARTPDRFRQARDVVAAGAVGAAALLAWAAPFELPASGSVVLWSIIAAALFAGGRALDRRLPGYPWPFLAGGALLAVAAVVCAAVVAPVERLSVDEVEPFRRVTPLLNAATPALVALAAALAVGAFSAPRPGWSRWAGVAAGAVVVWLGSVVVVDVFQVRVGTGATDLPFQAQVALSIAWVVGGAGAFAVGLARRIPDARLFGLGLLAVATSKVFLIDLASLDVAYRVLSFIGLGLVLLGTSFLAVRSRRPRETPGSGPA